jgi:hypothetical protein
VANLRFSRQHKGSRQLPRTLFVALAVVLGVVLWVVAATAVYAVLVFTSA